MSDHDLVNQKDLEKLLAKGKLYDRISPVRASILTRNILVQQLDGTTVAGHVGDYLLQSISGDKRIWVYPWDYFEDQFQELDNEREPSVMQVQIRRKQGSHDEISVPMD